MKLLSILTIACLLASAASLALPASTVLAEEDPLSWHVNACIGSTCPPDTVGDLEFAFDGEQTTADILKGKIVCTGMGCTQTVDVYYLVTGEVTWGNMYDFGSRTMTITTNGQATPIECGSGLSGHCYFHSYGMIEGGDINADPATAYHVITTAGVSPGATGDDVMLTIDITYSTNPIRVDECDTDYMDVQFVVEAGTFDADDETGVSQTLQAGLLYRLTVTGGPWQPEFEGENRWDSAIQLGEDDWRNTNDLAGDTDYVECFQHDPDNVHDIELVFTAPDADFSIRVNDLVGEFADNLGMMNYSIAEVQLSGGGCAGQFLPGSLIGTTTLAGTNSSGLNLSTLLRTRFPVAGSEYGKWIMIQVTAGFWKNQGVGDELRTMGIKTGISSTFWYPLQSWPFTGCADVDNDTYYIQMPAVTQQTFLRVYDTDTDFASNTGTLSLSIYEVADYTRYPDGCELNYTVGDYIESKTVNANMQNGLQVDQNGREWNPYAFGGEWKPPQVPKRYYMLETYGGPANLGAEGYSFDMDLAVLDDQHDNLPDEWHFMLTAPFVECVSVLDQVGHLRVFFALDSQADIFTFLRYWYAIRVRDTGSYTDNTGAVSYRLYQASEAQVTDPGEVPTVDGCEDFSHEVTATGTATIHAEQENGSALPALVSSEIYALVVSGGPWTDDVALTESYRVQLSDDGGDTWVDLASYPYLLCSQSEDGDHVTIYIQGAAGKSWRVRADDGNSNFADNDLTIVVTVYPGTTLNPWSRCQDNYNVTLVPLGTEERTIPGNMEGGKSVPIISGGIYAIEVTGEGMWYEAGGATGSYLLEIHDGEGPWQDFEGYGETCQVIVENGGRFMVYFTASSSQYRLRVRDTDDNFLTNTGAVLFQLYTAEDVHNPPGDDETPPPEWVVACNEAYSRPNGFISWQTGSLLGIDFSYPVPRVGEWIDYLRSALTYYLAWCPEHTAQLLDIVALPEDKDPVATIVDLTAYLNNIKQMWDAATATGGESGLPSLDSPLFSLTEGGERETDDLPPGYSGPLDLLNFPLNDCNRQNMMWWFDGGGVDLTIECSPEFSEVVIAQYGSMCMTSVEGIFGIASQYFCDFTSEMRFNNVMTYIVLIFDIVLTFLCIKWAFRWVNRMYRLLYSGGIVQALQSSGGEKQ